MDPLVLREIERERTALAILYYRTIKLWLKKNNESHKMFKPFINAEAVLLGKTPNITLKMLANLKKFCLKFCQPRVYTTIEISSDDESEIELLVSTAPNQSVENNHHDATDTSASNPVHLENVPGLRDQHSSNINVSSYQQVPLSNNSSLGLSSVIGEELKNIDNDEADVDLPTARSVIHTLPIPVEELPTIAILGLSILEETSDEPNTSNTTAVNILPMRRKSVTSRPKSGQIPSIAKYQIKHNMMNCPAIYAKPKDSLNDLRKIITVPYKNKPRPVAAPYDPKAAATKLEGIKEKIYAKNYLHIDARKKSEIQEKFQAKEKELEKIQVANDDDLSKPKVKNTKIRRKSVANPISSLKKGCERSRKFQVEKVPSYEMSDDGTSYVPPSHVLDRIDSQLAQITNETSETTPTPGKPEIATQLLNKIKLEPATSIEASEPTVRPAAKVIKSSRMTTRSKSMYVDHKPSLSRKNKDRLGEKMENPSKPLQEIFVAAKNRQKCVKKRGRPTLSKIVGQNIQTYKDPLLCQGNFNLPPLIPNLDEIKYIIENFDEENLLVEVEAPIKRRRPYVPKQKDSLKRRAKTISPPVQIKNESQHI